jgi:tetratricopeptide (TPR) repeat protein
MASRDEGEPQLSQLWQLPLLILSIGLFAYAAYLFIHPSPGMSLDDRIDIARTLLKNERPDAAIDHLNRLLQTEKLDRPHQARVHLLLAESLDAAQRQKHLDVPENHRRIIEQTRLAMGAGAQLDAAAYRRMGESYERLGRVEEAIENYRQAAGLEPKKSLALQRKMIDLHLERGDNVAAELALETYSRETELSDAEKAWALGERGQLLIDREKFAEGKTLLEQARVLATDTVQQGEVNYRLGYAAWKLGDTEEAERHLRVAREQMRASHPLDADASYALGRIHQDRGEPAEAISFYQTVIVSHPGSKVAPLARLGRGLCRIMLDEIDAGLQDHKELVEQILAKESRKRYREPVLAGLRQGVQLLDGKGEYEGALELLAYEQQLEPQPGASFFARLSDIYQKRADQIERTIADSTPAEKIRRAQQVRNLRIRAGDASVAYSKMLILVDDRAYGDAMWRGVELYDRAGDVQSVVSCLELFVAERPEDALAPDAVLRLGRAYQASGLFDKAIDAFQRIQFRYPKSLAASKSGVPLAQAYIAKGPEWYGKAETTLLGVVENNPLLTPQAEDYRQALFELAQLYYRTGRYEEAVVRLEEMTQRYPKDERLGQLLFLMADSYRKSGSLLDVRLASADMSDGASGAIAAAGGAAARKDRLTRARTLYDRVIENYRTVPPATETDRLYLKLSHFYRADCVFDLQKYEEAIRLYDAAAFRYQDDPSSLAAYVQIVNAYCALGKIEEAKTANERAKWLLRRMPEGAFEDGTFSMPKAYWEQWLKWTSDAGMW